MSKTHLTLSDRVRIQSGLDKSESFKKIAQDIGKNCTTVSREVRNHFVVERTGGNGKGYNDCLNKYRCKITNGECAFTASKKNSEPRSVGKLTAQNGGSYSKSLGF